MAQARTFKIVVPCLVSAFLGILLILHTSPLLAQSPDFLPAVSYASGGYLARSVTVGDVNGDGILDIVASNHCLVSDTCPTGGDYVCVSSDDCSHGVVGVLLGNGDGTFQPAVIYETSGYLSSSVRLGDLNGDGKLDVAVLNSCGTVPAYDLTCDYGTVDVMFGNGDGTFGPPWTHILRGYAPFSLALGDVNTDGNLDVAVADVCFEPNTCSYDCTCTSGAVELLLNPGGGSLFNGSRFDSGASWGRSVLLTDVNRDGKIDVLVANGGGLGMLLGNGNGTFQSPVTFPPGGQVFNRESLAVGDVNGDGNPDVFWAAYETFGWRGLARVMLGNGDGTFLPPVTYGSGGAYAGSVAVTDVNGDGKPDLVVTNLLGPPEGRSVGVLLGNGDGTFKPAVSFDSGGSGSESVAVGDFNRDGKPDLVVANGRVGVLLNNTPFCTTPPAITLMVAPTSLWPPNRRMVPVRVSGKITATTNSCRIIAAAYAVKDEYGEVQPGGSVTVRPGGAYSFTVWLQAWRTGTDLNGRLYTVSVSATNNSNQTASQSAAVLVPHDQSH